MFRRRRLEMWEVEALRWQLYCLQLETEKEVEALRQHLYCLQLETEDLREFCREVSCSRSWRDSGGKHLRRRHRHVNRRCIIR